jgi:hypothetical protein
VRSALVAVLLAITACHTIAGDAGRFVAVGYGGRRIASRDGVAWEYDQRWSAEAKDNDDVLFNVAFGAGRFIAVGGGPQVGHILSTRDGRAWTSVQDVKGRVATVAFGQGRFVAGHDAELLYSTTGEKFESGSRLDWKGSVHARRSACGDTEAGFRFVIIGDVDLWADRQRVSWRGVTSDGTRWEHTALDAPAARDIAYGAGHFVVVGPNGLIESSHDGQAWERREADGLENFSHIVWTGTRFLVTGGKVAWISTDALTWTRFPQTIPCSVVWAKEGALGLGFSWGGNIYVSHDFTAWKKVVVPSGPSLNAVAYGEP